MNWIGLVEAGVDRSQTPLPTTVIGAPSAWHKLPEARTAHINSIDRLCADNNRNESHLVYLPDHISDAGTANHDDIAIGFELSVRGFISLIPGRHPEDWHATLSGPLHAFGYKVNQLTRDQEGEPIDGIVIFRSETWQRLRGKYPDVAASHILDYLAQFPQSLALATGQ